MREDIEWNLTYAIRWYDVCIPDVYDMKICMNVEEEIGGDWRDNATQQDTRNNKGPIIVEVANPLSQTR